MWTSRRRKIPPPQRLDRRLQAIVRLAGAWRAPRSPWMRRARRMIPKRAPFSPVMTEACLRAAFAGWTPSAVARWVGEALSPSLRRRAEIGCAKGRRAGEVLLILPSTVFAAAWQSATAVWLAGKVPVFRPSRREPTFARLLAASAKAVGGRDLPSRVLRPGASLRQERKPDAVVAYGGDVTLQTLRRSLGHRTPLIAFGPQAGAAWVSQRILTPVRARETARRLAREIALYDTRGCLSPSCVFVDLGGAVSPSRFAARLGVELDLLDRTLPAGAADALDRESFDQQWRFRASAGRARWFGRHVILHREKDCAPSGLRRTVFVRPVRDAAEAAR
ncbi:MAG: hypothetical protein HUU04_09375, partial [Verrucomicrobiae bacterium]|nr:hypothetical protein [Verrucomicrobiae bacterium]